MSEIKTSFRASYGLDAAGEKVINMAMANKAVLTDGVNVGYLIQENTTQIYDPTRGYAEGFIVMYNDRLWISRSVVPSPSGTFNEGYWRPVRTDPKWYPVDAGAAQLKVGDYITVDTAQGNAVTLTLPSNAQEGDNIIVKDIGGQTGYVDVIVKAGLQSIFDKGNRLTQAQMTIPYSEWVFVYVNKLWNLYNGSEADLGRYIKGGATAQIQAGETIVRQYDQQKPITLTFPKNANNGDIIHFVGMDAVTTPYYNLVLNSFDNNTSIMTQGQHTKTIQRSLSGYFLYNSTIATWVLYDSDVTDRLRTVNSDSLLFPNETVSVVGTDNTTVSTIKLTLPQNVEPGDQITIALNYMRLNQTVNIVPSGTDKILTDKNLLQFPKRSSYPPSSSWVTSTQLTFNGTSDYPPIITFAYVDMGSIKQWMVVHNAPMLERVDPTSDATRARLGVAALATQTQANLNWENIDAPSKEAVITAETLANKTATETRRGIARISTKAENQLTSDNAAYLDDVFVTPKKLDQKQATEVMRGLAEIATQAETNSNTDDSRIITSLKLDARRATPTLAGVAPVVTSGGVAPVPDGVNNPRDLAGTYIYNFADYSNIVTPKTLREFKSTVNGLGVVYLATSAETIAGTDAGALYPLAVTPAALHTKTATEDRIGFTEIATQAETNAGTDDFRFITPKKLSGRASSETLTGLARYATQTEFDAGTASLISEPAKIKTFFSRVARTTVTAAAGLTQTGNLWDGITFNILDATTTQRGTTTLATQAEVDAGTVTTKIVTPATLQAKKATTTAEGIIAVATNAEVVAGTVTNKAVVPSSLINAIQVDTTWQGTTTLRGTLRTSSGTITFVGNDTSGSTQDLSLYTQVGYAVSPYELNRVLANYLPLKAKAVDSDLLDGLDSLQFIRRDIAQTVNGALTLTQPTIATTITASGNIASSTYITGTSGIAITSTAGDGRGISLFGAAYDQSGIGLPTYGMAMGTTAKFGTHGYVTGSHATYFTTNSDSLRGWVFKYPTDSTASNGNVASINAAGAAWFNSFVNSASGFKLNDINAVALESFGNNIAVGNTTKQLVLKSAAADTVLVTEASGSSYTMITTKNLVTESNKTYVRKDGDTMTGRLTSSAPMVANISETVAAPSNIPTSTNFGSWTSSIVSSSIYNLLPGYVVGVAEINAETGLPTGYIDHYDEFKGPGTLTQTGCSATDGTGTYQIWAPRPTAANSSVAGHMAQTFWTRQWNPSTSKWDGWGRMYTSNNPPTARDIGAMSDNGSVFSSLRIRDWIQVGPLRIYADTVNKTVRFDWVE